MLIPLLLRLNDKNIENPCNFLHFDVNCGYYPKEVPAVEQIFSYESKFMQLLMKLADMIILNFLFILFSVPIVTIGAAQAGLYSGIRQMMNREDDRSCIKAFFKGFASGFGKITLVHTCFLIVIVLLAFVLYTLLVLQNAGFQSAPVWMAILVLAVSVVFHSMLAPFHASFNCTAWQLARNMYFVVMAFFIRSLAVTLLVWLPIGVALLDLYIFMKAFPIWTFLYYSFAYLCVYSLTKKPFEDLKQEFLARQNPTEAATFQETEE